MVAQLQLLVAARGDIDDPRQSPRAAKAHVREQLDERVDALGRQQLAVRAAVPLLTTALALRLPTPAAHRSATARTGPVARRRQVRVLRVAVQQLRQQFDLL